MKKFFTLFVLLSVLLIPATGCYAAGPWRGKVIESDTKKPIDGAVVVAVWYSLTRLNPAGSSPDPIKVEETVTNAGGEFNFDSKYFADVPMLREVSGPDFLVYKPGYSVFRIVSTSKEHLPQLYKNEMATILLPKFEKKEDRLKAYDSARDFNLFFRNQTLKLNELIQNEEKFLGI